MQPEMNALLRAEVILNVATLLTRPDEASLKPLRTHTEKRTSRKKGQIHCLQSVLSYLEMEKSKFRPEVPDLAMIQEKFCSSIFRYKNLTEICLSLLFQLMSVIHVPLSIFG